MINATMWGGPRDGEVVTVAAPYAPVPDVLAFPELVGPPGLEDWGAAPLEAMVITEVRYRLRAKPRCCATWCVWPRPCTCCPRCAVPLVYDYVRP